MWKLSRGGRLAINHRTLSVAVGCIGNYQCLLRSTATRELLREKGAVELFLRDIQKLLGLYAKSEECSWYLRTQNLFLQKMLESKRGMDGEVRRQLFGGQGFLGAKRESGLVEAYVQLFGHLLELHANNYAIVRLVIEAVLLISALHEYFTRDNLVELVGPISRVLT